MGRRKAKPNAECPDCGKPFVTYGCVRCVECRPGKQGTRAGGRLGWHICPKCGGKKAHGAKQCMACLKGEKEGAE